MVLDRNTWGSMESSLPFGFGKASADAFYLLRSLGRIFLVMVFLSCIAEQAQSTWYSAWNWMNRGEADGMILSSIKMVVWAHQTMKMSLIHGLPGLTNHVLSHCYLLVHASLCKLIIWFCIWWLLLEYILLYIVFLYTLTNFVFQLFF